MAPGSTSFLTSFTKDAPPAEAFGIDMRVENWELAKYEHDPITGEKRLFQTIEGGDGKPTHVFSHDLTTGAKTLIETI